MVVIICGVAGAGKTTVGQMLARELSWAFYDGDDFHPSGNREKMRRGRPLTDQDRQPWLAEVRAVVESCLEANQPAVVACSVLKKKYREQLRVNTQIKFVFLRGDFELVAGQLRGRRGHFFDPTLLQSQFADLEEPQSAADAVTIELGRSPRELVEEIIAKLSLTRSST